MPVPLDPGDRRILILAAGLLLALVVVAFLVSPPGEEEVPFPSTYSSASGGGRAAYLLLKELGYTVERWEQPPTALPDEAEGTTLILAEPFFPSSVPEQDALRAFVRRGGRILATGPQGNLHLQGLLGQNLKTARCSFHWKAYTAQVPSSLTRGATTITMRAPFCWEVPDSVHLGVFGDKDTAVVVTYPFGKGEVILWAGSTPLTNAGISESHNLELFLNSVGEAGRARVLWDEYYHGHQGSLSAYVGQTPLLWGLAQLALVFLVICVTYARRWGPVRAPVAESRLSPLEYVETVGDLYRRAQAGSAAVEIAYQRFQFLLTRSLGLPGRATEEEMYHAGVRRLGGPDPEFFKILQQCRAAQRKPALHDSEAVYLVQALHDYGRILRLTSIHAEENRRWQGK